MTAMELRDLDHNQRLALIGLIEAMALSDRRVSDEEEDVLADVVEALGDDEYRKLTEEADERFKSQDDLKTYLGTVQDPLARELIYGTVLELAMADVVSGNEADLLNWLGKTWNLESEASEAPADQDI